MKALAWHGANDVRIDNVDDPKIEDPGDVIIKVTSTRYLRVGSAFAQRHGADDGSRRIIPPVCPAYSQTKYIEKNG